MSLLPFVSVIVPTYREGDVLKTCLEGLIYQCYPHHRYEVIVVNNAPDSPITFIADYPDVIFIDEAQPGSYAARNAALAIAKGEIIAFTDADCTPQENWLKSAVEMLQAGHDVVAGRVSLYFQGSKLTVAETYEKAFAFRQDENVQAGRSVTANMVTWRRCFEKVGLFDDTLMSGGDTKWSTSASGMGLSLVYAHEAVVYHPARAKLSQLLSKTRRVAGSQADSIQWLAGLKSLLMVFTPPIKVMRRLRERHDLTVFEKCKVVWVAFLIKAHYFISRAKLQWRLSAAQRV